MSGIQNNKPGLTVNALFMQDLMAAQSPCFALGYVEASKGKSGFIAMRPEIPIPKDISEKGMNFGHSVLEIKGCKVLQFVFEFYGHATYHGLVPISNPIAKAVISTMLESQDYFFFAVNPDHTVLAFNSRFSGLDFAGLKANQEQFDDEGCGMAEYQRAVSAFAHSPSPPGKVMEWVCRNNWDYLDLQKYPLDLTPRA